MDKKLIGLLSMFGLAMGVLTVFVIPPAVEPFCWLAIFAACAVIIARRAPKKYFVHGLLVSLANSVWITAAHVIFFDTYLSHHPSEAAMSASSASPRLMMLGMGPVIGVVSGCVLGAFSWIASKVIKPAVT